MIILPVLYVTYYFYFYYKTIKNQHNGYIKEKYLIDYIYNGKKYEKGFRHIAYSIIYAETDLINHDKFFFYI